ncbi:MAG TPA: AI-2E family transporter [Gemmatimonadales bacterium]|nr:AI-2E family transporter [Gemmatimonadales bacterium]
MSTRVNPVTPGWPSRDILRAAAIVAAVYIALRLLWVGRSVFLVGFFGILIGIVLSAGVDRLQRFRIPRGLGAALIVLLVLGALTGVGFIAAPQIGEQMGEIRRQIPEAIDRVEQWLQRRGGGVAQIIEAASDTGSGTVGSEADTTKQEGASRGDTDGGQQPGQQGGGEVDLRQSLNQQLAGAARHFFAFFSSTVSVLGGLILLLFVAIFVASDPGMYHRGLMHLFPHPARERAGEVLSKTATTLRRWLLMQMIAMLVIGGVTTVTLLLLGIKGAIALGIIAGLLEFVPYVGPILSAVPAVGMALVDGPEKVIWVIIAYTAIQQIEGLVLQPMLMKEGLELPPVVTILGQALFSLVFGFMGLLLAVPLLASVMVPVKLLYVRDVVGDEVTVPGDESG